MENAIGVYMHIPFCLAKCHYCSFCSYPVQPESLRVQEYTDALISELRSLVQKNENKGVRTVYIGGGTPSILPPPLLAALLDAVGSLLPHILEEECTLEVNPGTLSREKLQIIQDSPVNRISMGVQSANDELLARMGRIHTWDDARQSYDAVREAGIQNISVDLIYGLPGQDRKDWQQTLKKISALEPDHVSAYSLQVEEKTVLADRVSQGIWHLPAEEIEETMFFDTQELLAEAGLVQYEISSFCTPGRESRHNRIYWHNEPYRGLGAAAFSYCGRTRSSHTRDLCTYIQKINSGQSPRDWEETLTPADEMEETMMMTLRMNQGFSLDWFSARFGKDAREVFAKPLEKLKGIGLLQEVGGRIMPTQLGIRFNNRIGREFLGSIH